MYVIAGVTEYQCHLQYPEHVNNDFIVAIKNTAGMAIISPLSHIFLTKTRLLHASPEMVFKCDCRLLQRKATIAAVSG